MRGFFFLYGDEAVTPKFHYGCTHLVHKLSRMGYLQACFVLERASAEWDRGCSRDVTAVHLAAVQGCHANTWLGGARLVDPRVPCGKLLQGLKRDLQLGPADAILASREMRINEFERCMQGDVVLIGPVDAPRCIGEVHLHAEVNGLAVTLI